MKKDERSNKKTKKMRPALSPEARENQMIALAMDLAEQKLRDGTASSQLITEFVKRGSEKSRLEKEKLEKENELISAKIESIKSMEKNEALYADAIAAFKRYSGQQEFDEYE